MNRDVVIPIAIAVIAAVATSVALKLPPCLFKQLILTLTTPAVLVSIYTAAANFKVRKFVFYDYEPRVVVHFPRKPSKRELEFYRWLGILAEEHES